MVVCAQEKQLLVVAMLEPKTLIIEANCKRDCDFSLESHCQNPSAHDLQTERGERAKRRGQEATTPRPHQDKGEDCFRDTALSFL